MKLKILAATFDWLIYIKNIELQKLTKEISSGWVPGQKNISFATCNAACKVTQKKMNYQ